MSLDYVDHEGRKMLGTREREIAELREKVAALEVAVVELETKLLKDVAATFRAFAEYKQANDSTVAELRQAVTLLARARR